MRWVVALLVALAVAGCSQQTVPPTPATDATPSTGTQAATAPPTTVAPPETRFEASRAYGHVLAQVHDPDGNPRYRIPGTEGNAEVARYIEATLTELGYAVRWHHFNASYGCEEVAMHNVVAERAGATSSFVMFAAHYDTRPVADKDPVAEDRGKPILGANDGASGVAVLLELARVIEPGELGIQMIFFDGEDGGGYKTSEGCRTDYILGSRAYAQSLSEEDLARIDALVLVDMVGDPHLQLPREGYSAADARAAPVQDEIYTVADLLGEDAFLDRIGAQIIDDHVPFLERKVAAVDLIHTVPGDPRVFPAWHHTLDDDLDAVSADSLAAVGRTLEVWYAQRAAGP